MVTSSMTLYKTPTFTTTSRCTAQPLSSKHADAVPPSVLLRASLPEYLAILIFPPRFERRGFGGSPGRGAACLLAGG